MTATPSPTIDHLYQMEHTAADVRSENDIWNGTVSDGMPVSFERIVKGASYSRPTLARIWGYSGYQALARGVVTPADDSKIILFVTEEKQPASEPYIDELAGDVLHWEGPNDHFAESRMSEAASTGEEIHLFYRTRHHSDFTYKGRLEVINYSENADGPSQFTFRLISHA